jgi:hypothetical protein
MPAERSVAPVRLALALAVVVLGLPPLAQAESGSFVRFPGGGAVRTDCMLVTDVAGVSSGGVARCTDGDPTCDADGVSDGACTFTVRLCLDAVDPAVRRCVADTVTSAQATQPSLETALQAVTMPVTVPDTCTATTTVRVPRAGRRGRLTLRMSATMASGHTDRDAVKLLCVGAAPITFATLQKKIFTPSCASLSCHGAGQAGGLVLTAGSAYGDLVGVPATNPAAQAAGLLRVAPGDPERSFLLDKLEGMLTPDEGDAMPRVGSSLPASSIDLVRRWIAAGAPADTPF